MGLIRADIAYGVVVRDDAVLDIVSDIPLPESCTNVRRGQRQRHRDK